MSIKAEQFLQQKLRETIAECAVPALAAAMVRGPGATMVSAQQGVRKLGTSRKFGTSGAQNAIQPTDRFNLGSISKVFTGNLIGKLIDNGVGGLQWTTRIADVYPSIWDDPASRDGYKNVTIEQLLAHTSGMPYTPATDLVNDWVSYTAADMTEQKLRARRRTYIKAAVLDQPPYWPPGRGFEYSGGALIAASMAEQQTAATYETLMQQHIFGPLGMNDSGYGVLPGTWQHRWDAAAFTASADDDSHKPAYNWLCRAPVGSACCSAQDMALFMREQLRADPQVLSVAMRNTLQTHRVSTATSYVRGAWASSAPGSEQADISHNGDNGVSYALMVLSLAGKTGFAAMSNMNSAISSPAVKELHEVMSAMHLHWDELFETGSNELVEAVHPVPAITLASQTMMCFARRHDGKVLRYRSADGGDTWQASGDFGSVVVNSGLGAAGSADGQRLFVIGRGLDNKAWLDRSPDGGNSWLGWAPLRAGVFTTGPAIGTSASGLVVHAVGVGNDRRMWRLRSSDGGQAWNQWAPIGQGVFTSGPTIATSADGQVVHVFARGTDLRIWHNVSFDSAQTFQPHWLPIGKDIFSAGAGAAASDDGATVHVVARGSDRSMWRNKSTNSGSNWLAHWEQLPDGTLTSAPALATDASGAELHAYAFGGDFCVWANRSANSGAAWSGWQQKVSQFFL
jgi:CubicO group peptidase (beta-lactamase class C family)